MRRIAGHAQADELELYCLGGLTEVRCARIEEHLFLCETCRDRLTETEDYVDSMRQAGRQWSAEDAEEPAAATVAVRARKASWPRRLAPISIAALVVLCVAVWLGHRSSAPAPAPFAVELIAVRGAEPGQAPADRPLLLELDLSSLGTGQPFAGEVVDASGSRVARFPIGAPALVKALAPGGYFVRIYNTSGELLREYALETRR